MLAGACGAGLGGELRVSTVSNRVQGTAKLMQIRVPQGVLCDLRMKPAWRLVETGSRKGGDLPRLVVRQLWRGSRVVE